METIDDDWVVLAMLSDYKTDKEDAANVKLNKEDIWLVRRGMGDAPYTTTFHPGEMYRLHEVLRDHFQLTDVKKQDAYLLCFGCGSELDHVGPCDNPYCKLSTCEVCECGYGEFGDEGSDDIEDGEVYAEGRDPVLVKDDGIIQWVHSTCKRSWHKDAAGFRD